MKSLEIDLANQPIFDSYCYNILAQSNAPEGKYSKDDLRAHVMRMPHAKLTIIAKDILIEQIPIMGIDVTLLDWIDSYVLPPAIDNLPWEPIPFFIKDDGNNTLTESQDWQNTDKKYMPLGLEPCYIFHADEYKYENSKYIISDFRFLPLKSYEYRKA